MAIPSFPRLLLPLLRFHADGAEHNIDSTASALARQFQLTADELERVGRRSGVGVWVNKIAWAKAKLSKAVLIEAARDGVYRITPRGRALLAEEPSDLRVQDLYRYPEFTAPSTTSRRARRSSSARTAI